ncbi:MAG: SDR family NAD(P)-dependent oxidoreductase, partial [Candidatus Puniceispirillum sp.]
MELASSHAVITGGGSGLGEATARRLAAAGARLSILDRDMDKAGIVAKAVNGTAYDVDVTREDDVSKVVQQLSKDAGPPKILVNCAGIG